MHHLECQFDFEALKRQLESQAGVKVMNPFTDFPYLKQAFTEGERVAGRSKAHRAAARQRPDHPGTGPQFRENGAIGSHLEKPGSATDGFKGFNQTGSE